jgi:hypothetical protein
MSRSYRTQKESVIAARRARRAPDGGVKLPRIVEREPAPGDVHPLVAELQARRFTEKLFSDYFKTKASAKKTAQQTEGSHSARETARASTARG